MKYIHKVFQVKTFGILDLLCSEANDFFFEYAYFIV